ncbi:MAG TPA: hypothetical protein VJA66_07125 [Thermoanaerobaculia bacterium]
MSRRLPRYPMALAVIGALLLLLAPLAANAQVVVKVNDNVNFRFGLQFQGWADWTQDANSEGYSQNMFLRRIRFIMAATVAPGVSIFYQTDNPRLGNAGADGNKIINTGFLTQDAFVEWKLCADMIMLDAGLYLVPTNRNGLTGTTSFLSLDIGTWALQGNGVMKGNGGRDYGAGFHGYFLDGHFEYRLAAFDGNRNPTTPQPAPLGPAAGSRNSYRYAGRVQYDFLDPEEGDNIVGKYVYAGTNRGTRKILALGAWGDGQGDYKAYGGDVFFDYPLVGKDGLTAQFDYSHFEGGNDFPALAKQDDVYAEAGWYFDAVKIQPFARYENLNFSKETDKTKNQQRFMAGLNWYIYGQNVKLTGAWERIVPKTQATTAAIKNTNHFVIQLQAVYF